MTQIFLNFNSIHLIYELKGARRMGVSGKTRAGCVGFCVICVIGFG